MIEINLKGLKETIESALQQIKQQNQTGILCIPCEAIIRQVLDWSKLFHIMDGFFWHTPDADFEMIGLHPIAILDTPASSTRFQDMREQWQEQMQRTVSLVDAQFELSFPIAFGAFSFDEQNPHRQNWSELPENMLMVPEFLGVRQKEQVLYILQVNVTEATTVEGIEEKLKGYARSFGAIKTTNAQLAAPNQMITKEMLPFETWEALVNQAKQEIAAQHFSKVVLARETKLTFTEALDISTMLKRLYDMQKESYIFFVRKNGQAFIGATPEQLVLAKGKKIQSACIAGTERRGQTVEEDEELGTMLLRDDKNLREHRFVVEKVEESMQQVCSTYTIRETPILLKNKFIQHLYTPVCGVLKEGVGLLSVIEKMHPTPALGGLPKKESMEFLRQFENLDRGWYGSPIGWMDKEGNGEFVVGIRSGLVKQNRLILFSGCGIVADSDAKMEYEETSLKLRPMLASLGDVVEHEKS